MKSFRNLVFALVVATAFASGAWAQMMGGRMSGPPQIPGWFKPTVGDGSEYQMTTKEGPMVVQYAVVGKETLDGNDAFWNEIRMKTGPGAGTVTKQLFVMGGDSPGIKRMIVQAPGQEPMEMPMGMMGGMMEQMQKQPPSGKDSVADFGTEVGTETVTVPAGTFVCQHYRSKDGNDIWISPKVSPYGLVKAQVKDMTITLQKTLTGQTSEIKGEPRKFEMPHF